VKIFHLLKILGCETIALQQKESTMLDNRTLLAKLKMTQGEWAKLTDISRRSAVSLFKPGKATPELLNAMLYMFWQHPTTLDAFREVRKYSVNLRYDPENPF
jgi:DNA-binding XRE family transcriptional regulator